MLFISAIRNHYRWQHSKFVLKDMGTKHIQLLTPRNSNTLIYCLAFNTKGLVLISNRNSTIARSTFLLYGTVYGLTYTSCEGFSYKAVRNVNAAMIKSLLTSIEWFSLDKRQNCYRLLCLSILTRDLK